MTASNENDTDKQTPETDNKQTASPETGDANASKATATAGTKTAKKSTAKAGSTGKKSATAKKTATKKTAGKKTAAKKSTAKKAAAKKSDAAAKKSSTGSSATKKQTTSRRNSSPAKATGLRRVAIVGSARIPFCRSNTAYASLSNLDMLSDTLQKLSDKYELGGRKIDEVLAGAVTSHSRDWNLAREAVLGTDLSPATPGITLQMACGTSLQAAMMAAGKIASGQIDCAIAAGSDTASDVPIVFHQRFAKRLMQMSRARGLSEKMRSLKGFRLKELSPQPPRNSEPRTQLSMGQHCELMAREWQVGREEQDQLTLDSHLRAAAGYDSGFFDKLVMPHEGMNRDNNIRPDSSLQKLAALRPAFSRDQEATLTAGNSTPLTDGAASVFLVSEDYAEKHDLPVQAWLTDCRSSAIDFVHGAGLLMAPTVAVAELLQRNAMNLQDFEYYEIHEAFAAQVLCTLKAWEDESYCRDALELDGALGSIDRKRMNVMGGSLAFGHPFAATGARVIGNLSALLAEKRKKSHGLISVCTAGGMGAAAILESP